jgi:hypothetical protein
MPKSFVTVPLAFHFEQDRDWDKIFVISNKDKIFVISNKISYLVSRLFIRLKFMNIIDN